jgi:hypothetical protein
LINADPDDMASAFALKRLFWRKVKRVDIIRINKIERAASKQTPIISSEIQFRATSKPFAIYTNLRTSILSKKLSPPKIQKTGRHRAGCAKTSQAGPTGSGLISTMESNCCAVFPGPQP